MRIAVLCHFYPPEPGAASARLGALTAALCRSGHEVTVVTNFPSFPSGALANNDRFKLIRREQHGPTSVIRLFTAVYKGPAARLIHWSVSAVMMTIYLVCMRRTFECIITSVPPVTLSLPALAAARRHRAKLITDVRDVYPDVAVAMGEWKRGSLLVRFVDALVRRLYASSMLIGTVTPSCMAQITSKGVAPQKLVVVPNGCDNVPHVCERSSVPSSRFVAVYAGNLGLAADIDVIIDAAAVLIKEPNIAIRIVGDGVEGPRIRRKAQRMNLHNIEFTGAVSREQAIAIMEDADLALVPLRPGILDSVPTKIYDALAVGCPVLVAAAGEARNLIIASGGGRYVKAGDKDALAAGIMDMAKTAADELHEMGRRGAHYVRTRYDRVGFIEEYCARISTV